MCRPLLAAMLCLLILPAAARAETVTESYRDGLATEQPVPAGEELPIRVTFKNQDWTVKAGHRIALVLASSNRAWAIPDGPGLTVQVASGSSRLVAPVAP